jgi:hypothetical protein
MEDAMIISKSAFERGFGHGVVYKSEHVDLRLVLQNMSTQVILRLVLKVAFANFKMSRFKLCTPV